MAATSHSPRTSPVDVAAKIAKPRARRKTPNLEVIGLRVNAGLSRQDLAARAGVSRELLRRIETESYVPSSPRVQFAIAKVFGKLPLDLWPLEKQRVVQ